MGKVTLFQKKITVQTTLATNNYYGEQIAKAYINAIV